MKFQIPYTRKVLVIEVRIEPRSVEPLRWSLEEQYVLVLHIRNMLGSSEFPNTKVGAIKACRRVLNARGWSARLTHCKGFVDEHWSLIDLGNLAIYDV